MEAMPDAALHSQGSYVVIKLLDVAEPSDLVSLAAKLFPIGPKLTALPKERSPDAWKGVNILCKLVARMVGPYHLLSYIGFPSLI